MHQVKGVVARGKGQPVELVTINVPDPGPGEALVQVQACGVCHTDLHYREGGINDDFPFLLGHEAAGIVEAVGPDVTGVAEGGREIVPDLLADRQQQPSGLLGQIGRQFGVAECHPASIADRITGVPATSRRLDSAACECCGFFRSSRWPWRPVVRPRQPTR